MQPQPSTPHSLFIADIHLSAQRPDITTAFMQFLQTTAVKAEALYILGDLFDVWIGDDNPEPLIAKVATALKQLSDNGTQLFFIHGNRDFFLRQAYAKRCGMTLLPPEQVIDLYGTPTLIMHGDSLCTLDIAYQKFRKWWNQPWWQFIMLNLPLKLRQHLAKQARLRSAKHKQQYNNNNQQQIMDVTPEEVIHVMQQAKVNKLIHGHTHRPAVHQIALNGQTGQRYVLGDWYSQSSYLLVSAEQWQLHFTPLTD
ncbi:UDP-2,3-diacylglucosamine diphosphatase [Rheinheimera sp. MMS21-TC3]|uniref:UDP-2,3-diacylglucosamine diphosphatase n=1 Tax=Rheinheimera sp. MMS21-TC3 TaxID=3072790 RepID=UPI0028C4A4B5|nr:UDP-2,3-diacylglucosamine diphosphatase [Rheinheimera sp. MMS21-TC3]WNO61464.1 UDP-2,3-diacylglucosamine diphosphatase [Rheinheimera sp. MMS21-TC3]